MSAPVCSCGGYLVETVLDIEHLGKGLLLYTYQVRCTGCERKEARKQEHSYQDLLEMCRWRGEV